MRKLIFGMALLVAGIMASCSGSKTETTENDSVVAVEVVEDSVAVDSVATDSVAVPTETSVETAE